MRFRFTPGEKHRAASRGRPLALISHEWLPLVVGTVGFESPCPALRTFASPVGNCDGQVVQTLIAGLRLGVLVFRHTRVGGHFVGFGVIIIRLVERHFLLAVDKVFFDVVVNFLVPLLGIRIDRFPIGMIVISISKMLLPAFSCAVMSSIFAPLAVNWWARNKPP